MNPLTQTKCPDCLYLRTERAAIHEFDGGMSRDEADIVALSERCEEHKWQPRVKEERQEVLL